MTTSGLAGWHSASFLQFESDQVCNGHELEANHKRASETAASVTCGVVAEVAADGTGTIGQAGRESKDVLLPLFLVNPRPPRLSCPRVSQP